YISKPVQLEVLLAVMEKYLPEGSVIRVEEASRGGQPTLSPEVERIKETADGDRDFERELAELFISDAREHIMEIGRALADENRSELARLAHSLRGASANIGAEKLAHVCEELEAYAPTHD